MIGERPPRLLVLGGAGMLGHKLFQHAQGRLETWVSLREAPPPELGRLFEPSRTLVGVDALRFETVVRALDETRPDVVVNAIGLVKQKPGDAVAALQLNALFPRLLAREAAARGLRLIHVSTDCVFSGRRGGYAEDDEPDPVDRYGRSKLLGEVTGPGCLSLRTSLIGRELRGAHGLVEWLLERRGGRARGYRAAVFSGLTTQRFSELLVALILNHPRLQGLYHVAAASPIAKHDLLVGLARAFAAGIEIEPVDEPRLDRSLDARRFWAATALAAPDWPAMIAELAGDVTPYDRWRGAALLEPRGAR